MGLMRCRFCQRRLPPTKYVKHLCKNKKEARAHHENWRHEHRDDPDTLNRFPTFEAWDRAILDGNLVVASYPWAPPLLGSDADGESDVADGDGTGGADSGDEGVVAKQGDEWANPDDNAKPDGADGGGFVRPSERDIGEGEEDTEAPERPSLKKVAEGIASAAIDVGQSIRITPREKGWLPIVAGVHELIMWFFKGKDRRTYFKLNKDQKKILTASYQATFGDSPLLKLKTQGQGEYDVHVAVASIEVYGEFIMSNVDGGIERGKSLWHKFKTKKKEKENFDVVEDATHVEEERKGPW